MSIQVPGRALFDTVRPDSWEGALRLLATVLPDDQPSIVVLDEFPWLLEQDSSVEGVLQTVWDRELSHKPVFLIIIGSDLAMMERLSAYERPFHQRGVEMVLRPLTPWDVMQMTGLPAAPRALRPPHQQARPPCPAAPPPSAALQPRRAPDQRFPDAREIGGWWPRTNNPEVDLVAADRSPARKLAFIGSIKWHERAAFSARELKALAHDAQAVPGADADTPLVGVSRSGFAVDDLTATYGPDELVEAWQPSPA